MVRRSQGALTVFLSQALTIRRNTAVLVPFFRDLERLMRDFVNRGKFMVLVKKCRAAKTSRLKLSWQEI
jgi:hypothetical protein